MERKLMEGTELIVSEIALGTMHYGTEKVPEEEARRQMDAFLAAGGNFIDTARIYGAWDRDDSGYPLSEQAIGRWLWDRRARDKVVLSTKGAHPLIRSKERMRLHPEEIRADLERSLENLRTDYVDLYFLHRDDTEVPVSDILETLEEARREGKIRYYGSSNWTLGRIMEAEAYAKEHGLQGFSVNQAWLCLPDINRRERKDKTMIPVDREMDLWHSRTRLPLMAYSSIARGYLSRLRSGRELSSHHLASYENASSRRIARALEERGIEPLEASLKSLTRHSAYQVFPIVSFSDGRQMTESLKAIEGAAPEGLEEIWAMKEFTV